MNESRLVCDAPKSALNASQRGSSRRPSVSKSSTLPALERHAKGSGQLQLLRNQAAGDQSSQRCSNNASTARGALCGTWRASSTISNPPTNARAHSHEQSRVGRRAQDEHDDALARARTAWQVGDLAEADESCASLFATVQVTTCCSGFDHHSLAARGWTMPSMQRAVPCALRETHATTMPSLSPANAKIDLKQPAPRIHRDGTRHVWQR